MRIKGPIFSTTVAILAGLAVIFLRLLPSGLEPLSVRMIQSAASLAAVALVVGLVNLLKTHYEKINNSETMPINSAVLFGSLVLTFLVVLILGPTGSVYSFQPTGWVFQYIQVPVETSLVALLAVSLVYAAARLLRRSPTAFSAVFLGTALLVLLGSSLAGLDAFGLLGDIFSGIRGWITEVPAAGGARGLLIGVALGSVAAGIRIIVGTDRPFGR